MAQSLTGQINSELDNNSSLTDAFHAAPSAGYSSGNPQRDQLGGMVRQMNAEQGRDWGTGTDWSSMRDDYAKTQSYSRSTTAAYPVAPTRQLPNAPGGLTVKIKRDPIINVPQAQSPVNVRGGSGHGGNAVLRSTMEALHVLGEHAGNNQKVIESQVNK